MTYKEAIEELRNIAQRLENESLDLDQIENLLDQSEKLAIICRESLKRVGEKLNEFQQGQNEN